jgi:hypothetical protein
VQSCRERFSVDPGFLDDTNHWGTESLPEQTKAFLDKERLLNRGSGSGHWPMIDASDGFYSSQSILGISEKRIHAERGPGPKKLVRRFKLRHNARSF